MDLIKDIGQRGRSRGMLVTDGMRHRDQEVEPLFPKAHAMLAQASRLVASILANRYAILGMRCILAGVFIVSSYGKLVDIGRYSIAPVMEFDILPIPLAHFFGAVLPFVEALCALSLLFGVFTRLSSLGILAMSMSFFIAKEIVLLQGRDIVCGCFGAVVTTLASLTIYMDPPMMLMASAVMLAPRQSRCCISLGAGLPRPGRRGSIPSRDQSRQRVCESHQEPGPCIISV